MTTAVTPSRAGHGTAGETGRTHLQPEAIPSQPARVPPAAQPLRRQGLALLLRLAVLHPLRPRRAVPPALHASSSRCNNWNLLTGPGEWVGLGNYVKELTDPFFWNSLFNTISIFLLSAIPQLIAALAHRRDPRPEHPRQDLLAHERPAPLRRHPGRRDPHLLERVRRASTASINNLLGLVRPRPDHVEDRDVPRPHRHRDDGELALDRLQRPHPARGHAGGPARPATSPPRSTAPAASAGSSRSRSRASARP